MMRKKKTCSGCTALSLDRCTLGYKMETIYIGTSIGYDYPEGIPQEVCEKPRTIKKLLELIKEQTCKD
jgi:hypothetical protein